jgi:tetratricopeptide (TPR) repeat protein
MEENLMSITKTKNAAKAALVTAALTVAAGSVQAETPYLFTAIDTAGHGVDVVNGRYDKAIARIRKDGKADLNFSESTNLCIAYTYSGDVANAKESCDHAVEIARMKNGMPRFSSGFQAPSRIRAKDMDLVIALSNRSVVRAMNGEYPLAFEDLREADALKPRLRAVSKNLAVLQEATAR